MVAGGVVYAGPHLAVGGDVADFKRGVAAGVVAQPELRVGPHLEPLGGGTVRHVPVHEAPVVPDVGLLAHGLGVVVVGPVAVDDRAEGHPVAHLGDARKAVVALIGCPFAERHAAHVVVVEVGEQQVVDPRLGQGAHHAAHVAGDPFAGAAAAIGLEVALVGARLAGIHHHGGAIGQDGEHAFAAAGADVVDIEVARGPVGI